MRSFLPSLPQRSQRASNVTSLVSNSWPAARTAARHMQSVAAADLKAQAGEGKEVILLDIMDTVVYDPFFKEMPPFFNMSFKELLAVKHPTAWVDFELGAISEQQMFQSFFSDGRPVDGEALKAMLVSSYRYLDGMESLMIRLNEAGYQLHAMSNYPVWWMLIEEKLRVSRYLKWTFVSCTGPMKGMRKPSPAAYEAVLAELQAPAAQVIFVDDRHVNVDGAAAAGMRALRFTGSSELEVALRQAGLVFSPHTPL